MREQAGRGRNTAPAGLGWANRPAQRDMTAAGPGIPSHLDMCGSLLSRGGTEVWFPP